MSQGDIPVDRENAFKRNALWQDTNLRSSLTESRVLLGGVGGIGWHIGAALVGLGVRKFSVFDPDILNVENFNRLWGVGQEELGLPKAVLFEKLARNIDDTIEVDVYQEKIPSESFETEIRNCDVVFGGFDNPEARLACQIFSLKTETLYIDVGTMIDISFDNYHGFGQVFVSNGQDGCIVCAGVRQEDLGYRGESNPNAASSGVLNGILANIAVSNWLSYLGNQNTDVMTIFDWNNMAIEKNPTLEKKSDCPICGNSPAWS